MAKFTEYLESDVPRAQRGKCTTSQRVTLAPRVPASDLPVATYFHRALGIRNYLTAREDTFDDLTIDEQNRIRQVALELYRQEHPCAQTST
jgi:hypothetical protein